MGQHPSDYWAKFLRRRLSRRVLLRQTAVTAGVASLALAGCTSGASVEPTRAAAPPSAPSTPLVGLTPQATQVAANIKRGGTLVPAAFLGPVPHFDVAGQVRLVQIAELLGQCWSQLVRYRAQSYNDYTIVPDLADSWTTSADGKTWTFKLNPNAKWHNLPPVNGRPFTADDVVFTIKHIQNPANRSWLQPLTVGIDAVEATDPKTVTFRLAQPTANFLDRLANGSMKMLAKEVLERDGTFEKTLVGTGPFIFKSNDANGAVITRNPDYWRMGADGRPLPYIDTIDYKLLRDNRAQTAQLIAGNFHMSVPGGAPAEDLEELRKAGTLRIVEDYPPSIIFVRINCGRPPFDNVDARRALQLAIDFEDLNEVYNGTNASKAKQQGYVPYSMQNLVLPETEIKSKLKRDLTQARALAQRSNLSGQRFKLYVSFNTTGFINAAQALQGYWKEIGVETEIEVFPDSTAFARAQASGEYNLIVAAESLNGDPDNWIYGIWHSKSPTNVAKVNDPKIDKWAEDQRVELDQNKRKAIFTDFQRYMLDNAFWLPFAQAPYFNTYANILRNFSRHFAFGLPGAEVAWLDK